MSDPIAECRLDPDRLREQRDRYGALGRQALTIDRRPGALTIRFGPQLDEDTLAKTIAVENECCPFFDFDFSAGERRLTIAVTRHDQRPALDALAHALGDGEASGA
jgi:hypothetical protein